MKFNETKKVGLYICLINIILIIFIYSKDNLTSGDATLAIFSSVIAVILNIYYIIKGSKTPVNIAFLLANIGILGGTIVIMLARFI